MACCMVMKKVKVSVHYIKCLVLLFFHYQKKVGKSGGLIMMNWKKKMTMVMIMI